MMVESLIVYRYQKLPTIRSIFGDGILIKMYGQTNAPNQRLSLKTLLFMQDGEIGFILILTESKNGYLMMLL
jgi:hypothetical protein